MRTKYKPICLITTLKKLYKKKYLRRNNIFILFSQVLRCIEIFAIKNRV